MSSFVFPGWKSPKNHPAKSSGNTHPSRPRPKSAPWFIYFSRGTGGQDLPELPLHLQSGSSNRANGPRRIIKPPGP